MRMDEGYILSNKFRKAIFQEIVSGENDVKTIAKKHHILPKIAENIIQDLVNSKLLEEKNGKYVLTREGEKIATKLKMQEKIGT